MDFLLLHTYIIAVEAEVTCRRCTSALRQAGNSTACWQRGFAEEKKTGREGTTGEELSGDPNRVPKKGDQDKEGEGAMEVRPNSHTPATWA